MEVSIKSLEKYGLSLNQLLLGLGLVILGILTYYVAPQAFLFRKYEIFFGIMNLLLILMILGLTYLSILVLPVVQQWLVHAFLFFFRRDRKLKQVVIKNLQSHQRRNTKTAIMFAISLSFLIFAGSTFTLIARLIQRQLISSMGADLFALAPDLGGIGAGLGSIIEDGPIDRFLSDQKAEHGDVEAWTFVSCNIDLLFQNLRRTSERQTFLTDFGGYKPIATAIFSVQENYLEATDLEYLIIREIQPEIAPLLPTLSARKQDVVKGLYSDVHNPGSVDGPADPKHITTDLSMQTESPERSNTTYTFGVKALVPEGLRDALSLTPGRGARLCLGQYTDRRRMNERINCQQDYKINIRAMLQKLPGMVFTGFRSVVMASRIVVSEPQYAQILADFLRLHPETKQRYDDLIKSYDISHGIPKNKLFVKLSPTITQSRRDYLANGIRSYFRGDFTVLLDKHAALSTVQDSLVLFELFVVLVGTIALLLAFFLLLISTTQNIRQSVWEYGCLRAIGLTQQQGLRLYLYEQYAVTVSSLVLGFFVGYLLATVVGAQFAIFIELPYEVLLPKGLLSAMVIMALVTTYLAVYYPVMEVNKRQVASVVKGAS